MLFYVGCLTLHLAKLSSPRPPHASAEKEKEKEKDKGTGWFQRILQTYAPLSFDFNLRTQPRYLLFLLFLFIKYIFGYRFYLIKLFVRLFLSGGFFYYRFIICFCGSLFFALLAGYNQTKSANVGVISVRE